MARSVLSESSRVLKKCGRVFLREVLNQLWYSSPPSAVLENYWNAFNSKQTELGGHPFIGAQLGNLLSTNGFQTVNVEFQTLLFDRRKSKERSQMIRYWKNFFLSAERLPPSEKHQVQIEFQKLSKNPEGSFFSDLPKPRRSKSRSATILVRLHPLGNVRRQCSSNLCARKISVHKTFLLNF